MSVQSQGARPNYQSSIAPLEYKNKAVSTTNHESFVGSAVSDLSEITERTSFVSQTAEFLLIVCMGACSRL